jgi:putative aldouronate transport system permease protein
VGGEHLVKAKDEVLFQGLTFTILLVIAVVSVFPLMYVFAMSITPFSEVLRHGGFLVIPRQITFEAYATLLSNSQLPQSFKVTVIITVLGTAINLILTTLLAFAVSKRQLPGRSALLFMVVFTMLFNGGLIPTYLIVKDTGLMDTIWAMMIPNAIASFNVLLMKSFFENLPEELFESAQMDGASEFTQLLRIAVPLSTPVMATVGLFYLVSHWNEFFQAVMYITKAELHPVQVVVRKMLLAAQSTENPESAVPATTIRMAAVVLVSIPVVVVYPFLQRYFAKGMLLGAVKG